MNDFRTPEDKRPTFEETYPRYEFSELVRIGVAIGAWLGRRHASVVAAPRARMEEPRETGPAAPAS